MTDSRESPPELTRLAFAEPALKYMASLVTDVGAVFEVDAARRTLCRLNGIEVEVRSEEELYILEEVFARRVYAFRAPRRTIVIDVGANVGFAALHFAGLAEVDRVVAFEPFPRTVELAAENLERNPALASRIELRPYGLAARSQLRRVEFSEEWKGSVGLSGLPPHLRNRAQVHTVTVQTHRASEVIDDLGRDWPRHEIVVKMDCEGSEYEILEDLVASGQIRRISLILIEWHDRGPEQLEGLLLDSGYIVLRGDRPRGRIGMVYGFNLAGTATH
jgi:FkbM family methyltransferase